MGSPTERLLFAAARAGKLLSRAAGADAAASGSAKGGAWRQLCNIAAGSTARHMQSTVIPMQSLRSSITQLQKAPAGIWNASRGFAAQAAVATKQVIARVPAGLRAGLPARQQVRNSTFAANAANSTPFVAAEAGLVAGITQKNRRQIAIWLGVCSGWVFSMVVLGGVTRLTRSGLSMTDWKFTGEQPPRTQEEWEGEFVKYKASPEFKKVNISMGLEDFKFIFWMEYGHRMWGRVLGLVFAVPAVYFAARGALNRPLAARLGLLFLMGGTQGFVGWWMVKSGLQTPKSEFEMPRVSPYRLAAHLASAFAIYAVLLWTTLTVMKPMPLLAGAGAAAASAAKRLRVVVHPLAGLIAVTAISGAFVAGLDAGHAYNEFPLMGGQLVPAEYWALPGLRNFFENTAAVQFDHRVLAVTTLTSVATVWALHRRAPLPGGSKVLLHSLMAATALQVSLGITTLLMYVPVSLGSAHQAGALTLFSVVLALIHSVRSPQALGSVLPLAARMFTPVAAVATLGVWSAVLQSPDKVEGALHGGEMITM